MSIATSSVDVCDECGAQYLKTTHTKRFCSQSCARAWRKRNRTKAAAVDELREWRERHAKCD